MKMLLAKIILFWLVLGLVRSDLSSEEIKQAINKVLAFNDTLINDKDLENIKILQKDIKHYKVPLDSIQSYQDSLDKIKKLYFIPFAKPPLRPGEKDSSFKPLSLEEIKKSKSPQFYLHKTFQYSQKKNVFESDYATVSVNLSGGFVYENYVHIYMAQYVIEGILRNKPGILYNCYRFRINNDRRFPSIDSRPSHGINKDFSGGCRRGCLVKPVERVDDDIAECCCPYKNDKAREQTTKEREHSSNILAEFGKRRLREPLLTAIKNDFPSLIEDEDEDEEEYF